MRGKRHFDIRHLSFRPSRQRLAWSLPSCVRHGGFPYSRPWTTMSMTPIRVAVTGAAGQIGYSLLFRIASGALFGPNQPVVLHLVEIEPALPALEGVVMELDDGAFPLLKGIVPTANLDEAFRGVNWALLLGSG